MPGHELKPSDSRVFKNLKKTEQYAATNKMKLNQKKTKLMIFNPGSARDFMSRLVLGQEELVVVEETMLLGVKLRSDLSWSSHIEYIVKRANRKLWCIRRLKKLGADREDLVDVYCKQVRSSLEHAVSVWHSALTG